ncbi:MAG: hypothetical protein HY894_06105 [Deltaproteobacteria bacterium]|nr:hypothetical protein [Deltaproteobacteria bacterium]
MNELEKKFYIHPSLKTGRQKLHGYTSDEDGIRHSIVDEAPQVGMTEARYMLVACSAFVNYIIDKARGAGMFRD